MGILCIFLHHILCGTNYLILYLKSKSMGALCIDSTHVCRGNGPVSIFILHKTPEKILEMAAASFASIYIAILAKQHYSEHYTVDPSVHSQSPIWICGMN